MAFCDFCDCDDCKNGTKYLTHAQTSDGKWICDVCYQYDVCVDQKRKNNDYSGPCENLDCAHRPKVTKFMKG